MVVGAAPISDGKHWAAAIADLHGVACRTPLPRPSAWAGQWVRKPIFGLLRLHRLREPPRPLQVFPDCWMIVPMQRLPFRAWVYGLAIPLVYLVVEFSLNHRLIEVLGETVTDEVLGDLEFWGRVISGLGLGLLVHRLLAARRANTLPALLVCLLSGIAIMWHVQKSLVDYLVEVASPEDKLAALALSVITSRLDVAGLTTLNGAPVLLNAVSGVQKNTVLAMFPAAALHAQQREAQLAGWLAGGGSTRLQTAPAAVVDNAYKNLIVPPVAVGLSIFFALVNLCSALAFLVATRWPRWRHAVMAGALAVCLASSLMPQSSLLDSPGYQQSLRGGLWQAKPVLALLVEWSCRATGSWGPVSAFVHQNLALNAKFKRWPRH